MTGGGILTVVIERPHVLLSAAVSLDGYLDDASETRLVLSNDEDWARVDGLRAASDAILVGANTVRADDPRLLVRSPELVAKRVAEGRPEQRSRSPSRGAGHSIRRHSSSPSVKPRSWSTRRPASSRE